MPRTNILFLYLIFLSACGKHYFVSANINFKIRPDAKFIVRLTNTDFVLDGDATLSTMQLLNMHQREVMFINDFDSINYRYLLHLNDSWEPTSEELRKLHIYVNYDYLLVGG